MISSMYPLSHPQKRVWVIENIYPSTSMYNIGGISRFQGDINLEYIQESIKQLIVENESLRIQLHQQDEEVQQYILPPNGTYHVPLIDFSLEQEPEAAFLLWCNERFQEPFGLLNSPLYEFYVFRLSPGEVGYYAKVHHIICDGWAMKLIAEQIIHNYQVKVQNFHENTIKESYVTYLQKENSYLTSPRFQKDKTYWSEKFADLSESFLKRSSEHTSASRITYRLNPERSSQVRQYATEHSISLPAYFAGILFIYLSRVQQSENLTIGTPVLNRSGAKEKSTLGMFTSTMPLKVSVSIKNTVSNFMREVNKELLSCMFHQRYPYDKIVEDLQLKQQGVDQLFQHCINYSNAALPDRCADVQLETLDIFAGHQIYCLHVLVKDWFKDGSIRIDFEYKTEDYSAKQAEEIVDMFEFLIDQTLASDVEFIHQLEVIRPHRKQEMLLDWNATEAILPPVQSLLNLFEQQVALTPNSTALEYGVNAWTYEELNQKANILARTLQKKGIGKESVVALWATHSPETIVALWAILKAGGAFLPIDPEYPEERVQFMIEDSHAILTLTNLTHYEFIVCDVLHIDIDALYGEDKHNLELKPSQNQLAYVIYTSGSTGKPKGVMIEHKGLLNYIWWAKQTYVTGREVFSLYSSFAFDLTITSIFTPLICGSQIVMYDTGAHSTFALEQVLKDNRSTVVKLTPSHLRLIKDFDFQHSSIKMLIVGGEDLKVALAAEIVHKFNGNVVIYNEYGPTETVVGCMIHRFELGTYHNASVSIGKPIHNMKIYVLDNHLQPLPVGTPGDIYVSGVGVARGYLNRITLTEKHFINNPFVDNTKMYKTGDIGYFTNEGELHYLGRSDNQHKINGYRIELLEIEKALNSLPDILDAVVITYKLVSGGDVLAAYVQTKGYATAQEIKRELVRQFPSYMVPSQVMIVNQLPVTVNGKVDRDKLPKPESMLNLQDHSKEPSEIEHIVISVVEDVLGVKNILLTDNFFFIGGDSIKAIQISARLQNYKLSLNVKDILLFPIIKEHAELIVPLVPMETAFQPCEGEILPSPITNWFLKQHFPNQHHYLQSVTLNFSPEITYEKFSLVAQKVIEKNDSLRLAFNIATQSLYYATPFPYEEAIFYFTLPSEVSEFRETYSRLEREIKRNINMNEAPLVRFVYFDSVHGPQALLVAHHLLIDGVSWRIILNDFINYFESDSNVQAKSVHYRIEHSYQQWTAAVHTFSKDGGFDKDEDYWSEVVSNLRYPNEILRDENNEKPSVYHKSVRISTEQTAVLEKVANRTFDTKTFELITAALAMTVSQYTQDSHISFMLEGHGREPFIDNMRIENTVGWFTSLYPVNLHIEHNSNLEMTVRSLRNQLRLIPQSGFGYGVLSYLNQKFVVEEKKLMRLNYLGELDTGIKTNSFFSVSREYYEPDVANENGVSCLIDFNIFILNKQLTMDAQYDGRMFTDEQMDSFLEQFHKQLEYITTTALSAPKQEESVSITVGTLISPEDLSVLFNT